MNYQRILPALDTKTSDIIKGSIAPLAFQGKIIALAIIIPFLAKPTEAMKIAFVSLFFTGIFLLFLMIGSLLTFGPMVGFMNYPVLNISRVINIAQFLERFDPIIMIIWVAGGFVKITFFIISLL